MKVDNAIILAAGASSRFAPLSYEQHKALTEVKGEILIERQIRQLQERGVKRIYLVTGFQASQLAYLQEKFGVAFIHNPDYLIRNNHSSIWAARYMLGNSYICSVDNYFLENPFEPEIEEAYYAAQYAVGRTKEWCMEADDKAYIKKVRIGGGDAWYMIGHAFWSREFSQHFLKILLREYNQPDTAGKLWEQIFMEHIDELKMKIRKYPENIIREFDTLEELREFDESYRKDTRSALLKLIAGRLGVAEEQIVDIQAIAGNRAVARGFSFKCLGNSYQFFYDTNNLQEV